MLSTQTLRATLVPKNFPYLTNTFVIEGGNPFFNPEILPWGELCGLCNRRVAAGMLGRKWQ